MKYAYQIQSDGSKAVFAFPTELNRVRWIAAHPIDRGVLSGNSKEVKTALYRDSVILALSQERSAGELDARSNLKKEAPSGGR